MTPEYIDVLRQITDAAERGEARIITSALTLAEVVKDPDGEPLADEDEGLITDLFENEWLVLRVVDREVGHMARRVYRDHRLKPRDAIHAATAVISGVSVVHTTDKHLLRKDCQIGEPPLRIETPTWPKQHVLPGTIG